MGPEIPREFRKMPPEVETALKEIETGERLPPTIKPKIAEKPTVAIE